MSHSPEPKIYICGCGKPVAFEDGEWTHQKSKLASQEEEINQLKAELARVKGIMGDIGIRDERNSKEPK